MTSMLRPAVVALQALAVGLLPVVVAGQTPVPAPQPAPAAQARPGTPVVPPADSEGFDYNPEGRRDPFVSLVRRGADAAGPAGARAAGLEGLGAAEVTLKGTMLSRGGYVGILLGADGRTYIVRAGDRLLDGAIRSISANAIVIQQEVRDPLALEKQREVRKTIRQTDEAK